MKLYPYQDADADMLASSDKKYFVGDCGVGKTAISITAAKRVRAKKILVLCPAIARLNWVREIEKFWPGAASQALLKGSDKIEDAMWTICGYDTAIRQKSNMQAELMARDWDLLICDESHYLKEAKAKRTQLVFGERLSGRDGLVGKSRRVWLLSATPMPNHAGELYAPIKALAPELIENLEGKPMQDHEFQERYCVIKDTVYGRQFTGSKNLPELRERTQSLFYRRRKDYVLKDLPSLTVTEVELSGDVVEKHQWGEISQQLAERFGSLTHTELLAALTSEATSLSSLRRLSGVVKADLVADYIRMVLDGGEPKVIVFCHHVNVLNDIYGGVSSYGAVSIHGGTPGPLREKAIVEFQHDPKTRVFLGQIQAAGTAINLTAASRVIFAEASWVPAENTQAMSRAHRIGQGKPVLVEFLAHGSIDFAIARALARKSADIEMMIG